MDVKISYTTFLEDIPREAAVLVNDIRARLRDMEDADLLDLADSLERSGKVNDCNEGIVVLDSARKKIAKIDARMEDCMNILYQYCNLAMKTPELAISEDVEETDVEETDIDEEG